MQENDILQNVIKQAVEKGYFSIDDYSGLKLTREQFHYLGQHLRKKGIRILTHQKDISLDRHQAIEIISSLRKGVVPPQNLDKFTVGRSDLLSRVKQNLQAVNSGRSVVKFINADLGQGKTHILYLLREFAFDQGFAVSLVTLSQQESPLYKFLDVYSKIIWGIRTKDQRDRPALDNILDKWLSLMRNKDPGQVKQLIRSFPDDVKNTLIAYHTATNPISPNQYNQQFILEFLSGRRCYVRDLKRLGIDSKIEESNALHMLGIMAQLFCQLGFKGIVVLFDEAEAIHSLAYYAHKEKAYQNLLRIMQQSAQFQSCYFIYSTTPSFFDYYASFWPSDQKIQSKDIYELKQLPRDQIHDLSKKIMSIHCTAYDWQPSNIEPALSIISVRGSNQRVGDFVRGIVAFFDEKMNENKR